MSNGEISITRDAPAEQLPVFIGLEVGHAHYDRLREERRRNGGHTLGDAAHVVLRRRRRAAAGVADARLELALRHGIKIQAGARVHADA